MPQAPDHLMKETLYMKIIHLLDRHRTWPVSYTHLTLPTIVGV